ncbi:Mediator of RNA polymerase II transcription subunit 6 [Glycine soja]
MAVCHGDQVQILTSRFGDGWEERIGSWFDQRIVFVFVPNRVKEKAVFVSYLGVEDGNGAGKSNAGSVDSENGTALLESKTAKETIDIKEAKRVDHILASLQRRLPPAPPPPPFPEGYVSPLTAETEKGTETQEAAETQAPTADPIIDQGPTKRMKF